MSNSKGSERLSGASLTQWDAREQGKQARQAGMPSRVNPYPRSSPLWMAWVEGYVWQKVHYG